MSPANHSRSVTLTSSQPEIASEFLTASETRSGSSTTTYVNIRFQVLSLPPPPPPPPLPPPLPPIALPPHLHHCHWCVLSTAYTRNQLHRLCTHRYYPLH